MITYDYVSSLAERIIKWLISTIFVNPLKKSKISTYYQPLHSSTKYETILTKQYSFHLEVYHRRVDFMHNILFAGVRLESEEAVWTDSEKSVLLYDEKNLEKFHQRSLFFS